MRRRLSVCYKVRICAKQMKHKEFASYFWYTKSILIICPGGGIGRHTGLKILGLETAVRVRFSSWAPSLSSSSNNMSNFHPHYLRNISHELRNSLSIISGVINDCLAGYNLQKDDFNDAITQVERLKKLSAELEQIADNSGEVEIINP